MGSTSLCSSRGLDGSYQSVVPSVEEPYWIQTVGIVQDTMRGAFIYLHYRTDSTIDVIMVYTINTGTCYTTVLPGYQLLILLI